MEKDHDDPSLSTTCDTQMILENCCPRICFLSNFNNECPRVKNHSAILYKRSIYIFGGYDGKKNHNTLHVYNIDTNDWIQQATTGEDPLGRNGHTAALVGKYSNILFAY